MLIKLPRITAMLASLALCVCGNALAEEVTLKAISSFAEGTTFSRNFEKFVTKVNAEGKGLVQINYMGGPKTMPPFEVANAVRTGVVDIANVTSAFYVNQLPEADALKLATVSFQELRKNGGMDYLESLWNKKLNVHYLARTMQNMPYHLYLNKPIDKADLTGLKLRITPVYRDFFQALGANVVQTPPGEVYTALERGVVDGYGWPVQGIFDLGWQERTKYRVDPGFYDVEVGALVNLNTWKKLNDQQRAFLTKQALLMEEQAGNNAAANAEEVKRQATAGIQTITLSRAEADKFHAKAYEAGWASIMTVSPEHGTKLKALLSK